jgi:pyruvate/2-oxoglutarate dehydrogenase complex dihydrolipoamide dehydrogenase (E3) component
MTVDFDGVVLGGTVQGREAAALAAQEGARVALVEVPGTTERQRRRPITLRVLAEGGMPGGWGALTHRVKALETVADPHLSLDYLATLGVDVVLEAGQFSPRPRLAVTTANRRLQSRGYLLAPGTAVTVPEIPGLATIPYHTLDTLLTLPSPPETAIVLGGSGYGIALAQALAHWGTRTTLVSRRPTLLPTEDDDMSAFVEALLEAAGVTLHLGQRIEAMGHRQQVDLRLANGVSLGAEVLILATATHPALGDLNLTALGLSPNHSHGHPTALPVNGQLATAHPRIFACGPVLGGYWAEATDHQDVALALRNLLYLPWRTLDHWQRPALLYTTPTYARLGLTVTQARRWYGNNVTVVQAPFGRVLRAHYGEDITGFCRWVVRADGQIVGAQMSGPGVDDLMQITALAVQRGLPLQQLNRLPTLPHSLGAMLPLLIDQWQRQRWQPGGWRRDWAENWFNWRRSRPRRH